MLHLTFVIVLHQIPVCWSKAGFECSTKCTDGSAWLEWSSWGFGVISMPTGRHAKAQLMRMKTNSICFLQVWEMLRDARYLYKCVSVSLALLPSVFSSRNPRTRASLWNCLQSIFTSPMYFAFNRCSYSISLRVLKSVCFLFFSCFTCDLWG